MNSHKPLFFPIFTVVLLCALVAMQAGAAAARTGTGAEKSAPDDLAIVSDAFDIWEGEGGIIVTTLATAKNTTANSLTNVTIEIKYFNAVGEEIASTIENMGSKKFLPCCERAFFVDMHSDLSKEEFASQVIRVLSVEKYKTKESNGFWGGYDWRKILFSWGPMLLFISVWIFFVFRSNRKGAPQAKSVDLMERQVDLMERQVEVVEQHNIVLVRIADAIEQGVVERKT